MFEASRTLGGRAREVVLNGLAVDNGQHLLAGAYTETLRLLRRVGADPRRVLRRTPLTWLFPGHLSLRAMPLPAPVYCLRARR